MLKEMAEYASRAFKESLDIRTAIETLTEVTIAMHSPRNTGNFQMDELLLSKELDMYMKQESLYCQNKAQMFSVIIGQCTEAMKAKLEADSECESLGLVRDVVGLLNLIRKIAYNYEAQHYPFLALHSALKNFYLHLQRSHVTNENYRESFASMQEVVEHCGGEVRTHKVLVDYVLHQDDTNPASATQEELKAASKVVRESYDAIAFLSGCDKYPKTVVDATTS
mmetsp:Transcript_34035/g.50008  ORF Transcript_34035/g.50008 Transcript_34035/m.50008 type:complete len:224 (+) Transcript_34035:366-1037(+)